MLNINGTLTKLAVFIVAVCVVPSAHADGELVTAASTLSHGSAAVNQQSQSHDIYLTAQYSFDQYRQQLGDLTSSAENGDITAQHSLGEIYQNGYGVNKSDVVALMWYTISSENGAKGANKDKIFTEQYMASDQIKQARKMAALWLSRH